MNVAVYARVSTKHEEQITSLENQKRHYIDYCEKNKYNMVKMYSDEGLSATSPNRKDFLKMIYDAGLDYVQEANSKEILYFRLSDRAPKFSLIITKDVSRYARNIDAMKLTKQLRDKGVYVLFENAGFSTEDKDWEMRLSLLLTFSQQESLDRSKKVEFAYKQRAKLGIYHLARNLYGYNYDSKTKSVTVIEKEADVVRKMFDLFINHGYGVKSISNYLNENKITTQNGKEWVAGNVRRLLRNEKYIGTVILNKYTNSGITSSNKKIKRPESEWEIHENAIPAIIDKETWNKAQGVIKNRVDNSKEGSLTGTRKVKNIFYNKLYCGMCNKPFVRIVTTKKRKHGRVTQINYMCANRRHRNSCDNKMITHNVLEKRVINFTKNELREKLAEKKELHIRLIEVQKKMLNSRMKMSEKIIQAIKLEINDIENEVDKLLTAFAKSSSTVVSVIEKKIEQLEERKLELNQKLLNYDVVSIESELSKLDDSLKILSTIIKSDYTFEETLQYLGKITVTNDDIKFNVVADRHLEPLVNIDIDKIDNSKIDSIIDQMSEATNNFMNSHK